MKMTLRLTCLLLCASIAAACGNKHDDHGGHDHGAGCGDGHGHAHDHEAKHGGTLAEFGNHDGVLETKLDHGAGTLSLWVYDHDMKESALAKAPVLNLVHAGKPLQLTGTGSGAAWTFQHDALKDEPKNARFRFESGGKTFTPALDHHH